MKQKFTFKSLLLTASVISFFAFAFVNLRTNASLIPPFSTIEMSQNQVESEETAESNKIPVPDVSVLGRIWGIAERLLSKAN